MYRVRTNNTEFKKKVMLNSRFFPLSHSGNRWSSEVELFGGIFIYCVTKCHVHLRIRIYDASEDKIRCSICCECMLMIKARTCADPDFAGVFSCLQRGSNGFITEKTILFQVSRGGPTFSREVPTFSRWDPNANFYRNTFNL